MADAAAMKPINGRQHPGPNSSVSGRVAPNAPKGHLILTLVAEAILSASTDGKEAWEELTDDERADFLNLAEHAAEAYTQELMARGFRLIPPSAVLVPQTAEEAVAMIRVAQGYLVAQAKKPGLLAPKQKLIRPGAH